MCHNPETNTTNTSNTNQAAGEKKIVTREFLGERLTVIRDRVGRAYSSAPYGSSSEEHANQARNLINELQSDLAAMQFEQPKPADVPRQLQPSENYIAPERLAPLVQAVDAVLNSNEQDPYKLLNLVTGTLNSLFWKLPNRAPLEHMMRALASLVSRAEGRMSMQAKPAPIDITETVEREILGTDETLEGITYGLLKLWGHLPVSRVHRVLDVLTDRLNALEDEDEDEDEEGLVDFLTGGTKDAVLNRIEDHENPTPYQRAHNLRRALLQLYDEADVGSDLEEMADSLSIIASDLEDQLAVQERESKQASTEPAKVEIVVKVNGKEVKIA